MNRLKSILVFLVLQICLLNLYANKNDTDSLLLKLNTENKIIKKVELLIELSKQYQNIELSEAHKYIDNAIELAIENKNDTYTGKACFQKAGLSEASGNANQALEFSLKALGFYESISDSANLVSVNIFIGNLYKSLNDNKPALKYYTQALDVVKKTNNAEAYAIIANNMGLINETLSNYNTALDYYYVALRKFKKLDNCEGNTQVLTNIANVYFATGDEESAIHYFQKALELDKQNGNGKNEALILMGIGKCLIALNQPDKAKVNLLKS
ncbi:MAG: tetratricopeptide repeat protein, partial [Bacteroidota bacterium]|nr:tetratricopeptide repeat protein [Bacteroidota bacterium]